MKSTNLEILHNRLRKSELGGFHNHELLELLLSFVLSKRKSMSLAKILLERYDGIRGVFDASIEELESLKGMDQKAVIFIKLLKESVGLYLKERIIKKNVLSNLQDIINFLKLTLSHERIEKFLAIYLNAKNEMIEMEVINEGTINQVIVYPRVILEGAFRHDAISIILIHNHPSGDATPSYFDYQLTQKILRATSVVGIMIHDHIIIGNNTYFSGRECGWLNKVSNNLYDFEKFHPGLLHE